MADQVKEVEERSPRPTKVRFAAGNANADPQLKTSNSRDTVHPRARDTGSPRRRSISRGRSRSRRPRRGPVAEKGPLSKSEVSRDQFRPSSSRAPHADAEETLPLSPRNPQRPPRQTGASQASRQPPQRTWAAVARSATKGYNLSYVPPVFVGDNMRVKITEDILESSDPKWDECLVGYLIGKKLPFKLVEAALKHVWGAKLVGLLANDDGFYFMHIPDREFRRNILDGSCFTIAKVPFILQQYSPLMDLQRAKHHAVPIWVRLRNIPYSLWSAAGISAIASAVGRPLYVDSRTEQMTMISFARVCVEVQGGMALPDKIEVEILNETRSVQVEYEWKPSYCPLCSTFGHRCPEPSPAPPAVNISPPVAHAVNPPSPNQDGWQTVGGKTNRKETGAVIRDSSHAPVPAPSACPTSSGKLKVPAMPTVTSSVSEDEESSYEARPEVEEDLVPSMVNSTFPMETTPAPQDPKGSGTHKQRRDKALQDTSSSEAVETPRLRVATRQSKKRG